MPLFVASLGPGAGSLCRIAAGRARPGRPRFSPMPSIALVMIARDESRCIRRALLSVRQWVDEVCVLDTGSADDTVAIATACGARVAHRAWDDDFAAARNAALEMTDCDWRLVLDADEWIAAGGAALRELTEQPDAFVGLIRVDSLIEGGTSSSWLPRLLPRGVAYEGRVHEQPASALPRRRLALVLAHDGYLPGQMAGKAGRNRRLLECALAESPGDAYLAYQLGKDHEVRGDHAAAEPLYARAAAAVQPAAAWRHDLVLRRLFTLKKLRRFDEAAAVAESEAPHWGHSPDFHFAVGDLMLDWALSRPAQAAGLLHRAEASWQRALQVGENPHLPDRVPGRGSWLAAHNLAVLYGGLGDAARAGHWQQQARQMRVAAGR